MADAGAARFTPHRAVLNLVTGRATAVWVCDAYETAMRGRGLAERTWAVYGQTARALAVEHDLATVTAGEIEQWLAGLDVTGRTRGAYLVRLRGLFKWLVREGLRPDNPCDLIEVPSVPARQPRPIPDRYLRAAWNVAQPRERAAPKSQSPRSGMKLSSRGRRAQLEVADNSNLRGAATGFFPAFSVRQS
jgi:hypothetical protein